ncbi:hypothetical protein M0805_002535 [Coniferiporia weirii]|nr:hypothetical protein M0805_002535 [Coniferiporia weirii]
MDAEHLLATSEVAMEYAALKNDEHCPTGMYILPSADSLLAWDGVLFVHQGYYADAVLKFRVRFPQSYPARAPDVVFATDVFHPLIAPEGGALNLAPRFAPWRPKQDHVFHVLHWIKAVFKKETIDKLRESDCPNKEAFRYQDSTQSFAALATQCAMLSQSAPTLFESANSGPKARGQGQGAAQGILFREAVDGDDELDALRTRHGLRPWVERAGA